MYWGLLAVAYPLTIVHEVVMDSEAVRLGTLVVIVVGSLVVACHDDVVDVSDWGELVVKLVGEEVGVDEVVQLEDVEELVVGVTQVKQLLAFHTTFEYCGS